MKKKYTVDNQGTVYLSIQGVVNFYEISNRLDETSTPNIFKVRSNFPAIAVSLRHIPKMPVKHMYLWGRFETC